MKHAHAAQQQEGCATCAVDNGSSAKESDQTQPQPPLLDLSLSRGSRQQAPRPATVAEDLTERAERHEDSAADKTRPESRMRPAGARQKVAPKRGTRAKARDSWTLDSIMSHKAGLSALQAFCKTGLSEENLAFVQDAQAWRQQWAERTHGERQSTADALIAKFLKHDSPMEVSVPGGYAMDTPLSKTMFDGALTKVRSTLTLDILPRFEDTEGGSKLKAELAALLGQRSARHGVRLSVDDNNAATQMQPLEA